jgi:hypothetical protein
VVLVVVATILQVVPVIRRSPAGCADGQPDDRHALHPN